MMHKRLTNEAHVCFPSGITVLEGGPGAGPKSWLMPQVMAGADEVFCYTTQGSLDRVVKELGISLIADAGDSTATRTRAGKMR